MTHQRPQIVATVQTLPFEKLSPEQFERLCLWLVAREGYQDPQHLGATGNEQGRDIIAWLPADGSNQLWYFQCKRRTRVTLKELTETVDGYANIAASDPAKKPYGIVFLTNATLSAALRDKLEKHCTKHGYASRFWAHTELDMLVWRHPGIVKHFFYGYVDLPPSVIALHQLPRAPSQFVGRDKELQMLLEGIEGGVNISGLWGMGGIGKTALALVVADRLAGRYPDAQFFLDLRGTSDKPLSAGDAMAHVLRSIDPQAKLPEDEAGLAAAYRSALHPRRTILLMDNARDAAQVLPLVPPPGSILLVTSRRHFAVQGLNCVDLHVLDEQDAVRLLLVIEKRVGKHAAALARLCGYLPLALRAAGSLLQVQRNLSPADYVRQLEEERSRLEKIGKEGVEIGVEACLDLSYRQLPAKTAAVFRRLAVFPGSFDPAAEETVCQDPGHAHLSELLRYSLVDYDEAAGRYRLHDLARIFADARLTEPDREVAQRRHAAFFLTVLASADDLYLKGGEAVTQGLALFDMERANIEAGRAWACSQPTDDKHAARLCSEYADAGAYCLSLRQHPRDRIAWLEVALAAAQRGKDRVREVHHLSNIGTAYCNLGEYPKAMESHEQALAIARKIGHRPGEGAALGNLGAAYARQGKYPKALQYWEETLAISHELHAERAEGNALCGLGGAYLALLEYRKAIKFLEQARVIYRKIGDRRGEAQVLGNLGIAHAALGEHPKAIKFYSAGLDIAREIGNRRGEGTGLINRALSLYQLGDRAAGIADAEAALVIFEQIESPDARKVRELLPRWRGS